MHRVEAAEGKDRGVARSDVVGDQKRLREGARPAPLGAHGEALAAQVVELGELAVTAVEDPQRIVEEGGEHLGALRPVAEAALHEGHVHARRRIRQQPEAFRGSRGRMLDERDAVLGEHLRVLHGKLVVDAVG